jgi:hypothetical protein
MGPGAAKEAKTLTGNVEWAGAQTRYFLAAILPDNPRDASTRFTPVEPGETALLEVGFGRAELPPGGGLDREYRVYLGPKEPERLDSVGAHLDAAIAKGWFPPLTRFFTWLLTATHGVVHNYGVAIILITIVVRLLLAPLMARQMRSMKRMSVLQPRMKEIQERFSDDRQKQSEAMMALYKEAGVNPLSMMTGCLPMFLQLPVFIGFYYALQGAIGAAVADPDGSEHGGPAEADAIDDGSGAGAHHAHRDAGDVHRDVLSVCVRSGSLLVRQHPARHRPADADEPPQDLRTAKGRSCAGAQ